MMMSVFVTPAPVGAAVCTRSITKYMNRGVVTETRWEKKDKRVEEKLYIQTIDAATERAAASSLVQVKPGLNNASK
jgi:hypothetical protein